MILGITGHRPPAVGGYRTPNPIYNSIIYNIRAMFTQLRERESDLKIITGMALGVDQWAAQIALEMQIPYGAAIPFPGFDAKWPSQSKAVYNYLLEHAAQIVYVCEPGYAPIKMQIRNRYIVDISDEMLAVWNGTDEGGTANCVGYALDCYQRLGRPKMNYIRVPLPPGQAPILGDINQRAERIRQINQEAYRAPPSPFGRIVELDED